VKACKSHKRSKPRREGLQDNTLRPLQSMALTNLQSQTTLTWTLKILNLIAIIVFYEQKHRKACISQFHPKP
jgi:hypothetical protein